MPHASSTDESPRAASSALSSARIRDGAEGSEKITVTSATVARNVAKTGGGLHALAGTTTLDSFNYTFDSAAQISQETSTLGPTRNYTMDNAGQVTGNGTESFAWDANGNLAAIGIFKNAEKFIQPKIVLV